VVVVRCSIQQRSGRKTLTTVQGISPDYDQKRLVKVLNHPVDL
jgi:translation initiation factor 1